MALRSLGSGIPLRLKYDLNERIAQELKSYEGGGVVVVRIAQWLQNNFKKLILENRSLYSAKVSLQIYPF